MAAAARHGRRRLSPPWLPLSLSLMISCFLCGSLPRPPTGAHGLAVSGVWPPEGKTVEASRKTLTGRMAGCPPPLSPTFIPSSSSSSPQLHRQTVKRESSICFLLSLSLSFTASVTMELSCRNVLVNGCNYLKKDKFKWFSSHFSSINNGMQKTFQLQQQSQTLLSLNVIAPISVKDKYRFSLT